MNKCIAVGFTLFLLTSCMSDFYNQPQDGAMLYISAAPDIINYLSVFKIKPHQTYEWSNDDQGYLLERSNQNKSRLFVLKSDEMVGLHVDYVLNLLSACEFYIEFYAKNKSVYVLFFDAKQTVNSCEIDLMELKNNRLNKINLAMISTYGHNKT